MPRNPHPGGEDPTVRSFWSSVKGHDFVDVALLKMSPRAQLQNLLREVWRPDLQTSGELNPECGARCPLSLTVGELHATTDSLYANAQPTTLTLFTRANDLFTHDRHSLRAIGPLVWTAGPQPPGETHVLLFRATSS